MKIVVLLLVGLVVVGGLWWLVTYNRFVALRNLVEEAWKQTDVQLQRRHDVIPNLVRTVQGYAAHERAVLEEVVAARGAAVSAAGPAEQERAENVLSGALSKMFALAESYPDLKASGNFLELQREIADTEDRIAAARRIYNANVREFNTKQETVPASLVAKQMGLSPAGYFEVQLEALAAPTVEF